MDGAVNPTAKSKRQHADTHKSVGWDVHNVDADVVIAGEDTSGRPNRAGAGKN